MFTVNKATSEIDFFLPLIWKLKRERPEVEISLLFLSFDKRKILRESNFYMAFLSKINVGIYDFFDFSSGISRAALALARAADSGSAWDMQHLIQYSVGGRQRIKLEFVLQMLASLLGKSGMRSFDFGRIFDFFKPQVEVNDLRGHH